MVSPSRLARVAMASSTEPERGLSRAQAPGTSERGRPSRLPSVRALRRRLHARCVGRRHRLAVRRAKRSVEESSCRCLATTRRTRVYWSRRRGELENRRPPAGTRPEDDVAHEANAFRTRGAALERAGRAVLATAEQEGDGFWTSAPVGRGRRRWQRFREDVRDGSSSGMAARLRERGFNAVLE